MAPNCDVTISIPSLPTIQDPILRALRTAFVVALHGPFGVVVFLWLACKLHDATVTDSNSSW